MPILSLFFASLPLLFSCTNVGLTRLTEVPAKADGCPLTGYFSEFEAPASHEVLCQVTSRVVHLPWSEATSAEALSNAWPFLCRCGADAFVVGPLILNAGLAHMQLIGLRLDSSPSPSSPSAGRSMEQMLTIARCHDSGSRLGADGNCRPPPPASGPLKPRL